MVQSLIPSSPSAPGTRSRKGCSLSSQDKPCCVRILAYIWKHFGAEDYSVFGILAGPIPAKHNYPSVFKGYELDVTLEIEATVNGRRHIKIADHYGDGEAYQTLAEAQKTVLMTTGVVPVEIAGRDELEPPPTGENRLVVAELVVEFVPSGKDQEHVETESLIKELARLPRQSIQPITVPPSTLKQ